MDTVNSIRWYFEIAYGLVADAGLLRDELAKTDKIERARMIYSHICALLHELQLTGDCAAQLRQELSKLQDTMRGQGIPF
jgi:hypothetical protein